MITIDLSGPEGNAYVLVGYAKTWGKQLGLDTGTITSEMTSGDYKNLIAVFEKNFGLVCKLLNKPEGC